MRRIDELDAEPRLLCNARSVERHAAALIGHFAEIMSRWTDAFVETEAGRYAGIAPGTADVLVSRSHLLAEIKRFDSSLVTGPVLKERQHWTPIGLLAWNGEPPSEARFIPPQVGQPATVKPFGFGLYTSTASAAGVSMWSTLLEPDGLSGYPLPRYTWELKVDAGATVVEIGDAATWVEFVSTHARTSDSHIFPDWTHIARSVDAVHLTLPAIVAAQGFTFCTRYGVIPAAFWDVETTVWLRWCFSGARLVETVPAAPPGG
jgi:hypothetical protein